MVGESQALEAEELAICVLLLGGEEAVDQGTRGRKAPEFPSNIAATSTERSDSCKVPLNWLSRLIKKRMAFAFGLEVAARRIARTCSCAMAFRIREHRDVSFFVY